jgi:hypothetical protein
MNLKIDRLLATSGPPRRRTSRKRPSPASDSAGK